MKMRHTKAKITHVSESITHENMLSESITFNKGVKQGDVCVKKGKRNLYNLLIEG